jgi:hypothetical protein
MYVSANIHWRQIKINKNALKKREIPSLLWRHFLYGGWEGKYKDWKNTPDVRLQHQTKVLIFIFKEKHLVLPFFEVSKHLSYTREESLSVFFLIIKLINRISYHRSVYKWDIY